jgi:uncharacterized membrane protein YdjX (TVP38/TMEM64 family)
MKHYQSWFLLLMVLLIIATFYLTDLKTYFSFSALKMYHQDLTLFVETHLLIALILFSLTYVAVAATSLPIAAFLTILGGFLFGPFLNLIIVDISATLGATCLFLILKTTLGKILEEKGAPWVKKMKKGFQKNAFFYLLFIRLIPIFPFWAVNLVAALLNTSLRVFVTATLIGIIPVTFVYSLLGKGLSTLLEQNKTSDTSILFEPSIFFSLCGLALLSLLPVFFRMRKDNER